MFCVKLFTLIAQELIVMRDGLKILLPKVCVFVLCLIVNVVSSLACVSITESFSLFQQLVYCINSQ